MLAESSHQHCLGVYCGATQERSITYHLSASASAERIPAFTWTGDSDKQNKQRACVSLLIFGSGLDMQCPPAYWKY